MIPYSGQSYFLFYTSYLISPKLNMLHRKIENTVVIYKYLTLFRLLKVGLPS